MNASGRPNTCKSNGNRKKLASSLTSGARVRNTYATYLLLRNSPEKFGLIPHNTTGSGMISWLKVPVRDGHADY